jgi:hypothetical protein
MNADVVFATSTEAAVAAMADDRPDLIVTSSLLAPDDDQRLAAHLRTEPGLRHLPVLTIPPLVDEDEDEEERSGVVSLLRRRRQRAWRPYDVDAVIARIQDSLEESRAALARSVDPAPTPPIEPAHAHVLQMTDAELRAYCGLGNKRARAKRFSGNDLPWISGVRLGWGLELRLLNVSRSGLLVESGIRLTPGNKTSFLFSGPQQDLVLPARVIRSRVSTVDPLGVRYVTAAQFERPFDSLSPGDVAPDRPSDPKAHLAFLVEKIQEGAAEGIGSAELRAEFEAGVRELVTAQEIRLRQTPVVENDGRDSVYFTVPTRDGSPAILQVTFSPNYRPGADEFAALRAAATAAADIVELTEPARPASLTLAQA